MPYQLKMSGSSLQGKIAIVTGASRGIGRGITLELARRGAKVAIVYTSMSSERLAEEVVSEIKSMGNDSAAIIIQADLSKVESPDQIVAATTNAFGAEIDILVNNAGLPFAKAITEVTAEDYATIFDVNVRAPLLLTGAVVPHLRAPGRIINISSVAAHSGFHGVALYAASKAALEGMTRSLAQELGGPGHTVNVVAPGPTESEMLANVPEEVQKDSLNRTPVQHRFGTPDDIARIVAWLAGEDSKWVSGQTISASGGYLML
ncbi:NAD(P)-binding protein [Plenodomus tracheiphilus IPT5]|uniref:NAD(P)-binding protein n=1 Tax=Plenodomus tracheiphilus IPT5 TaxID=1408161 RepID=A0A6A7B265_9PLEO|nr:NAD(P)-binding protein [Plenodomus tracheiphilus IPT5]